MLVSLQNQASGWVAPPDLPLPAERAEITHDPHLVPLLAHVKCQPIPIIWILFQFGAKVRTIRKEPVSPLGPSAMPNTTSPLVGIGAYSPPEAARILKIHINTLRKWIGGEADREPVITRRFTEEGFLTFTELMELQFIQLFRAENVSMHVIRKTAAVASDRYGTDYPFSMKRFDTDGKTIFATLKKEETDEEFVEDLTSGQLVFQRIIRPFFKKLGYNQSNEPCEFWPLSKRGRVVLNPRVHFGQPVDYETSVPVDVLWNAVRLEEDLNRVAKWYDVPLAAVKAAVKFQTMLSS